MIGANESEIDIEHVLGHEKADSQDFYAPFFRGAGTFANLLRFPTPPVNASADLALTSSSSSLD